MGDISMVNREKLDKLIQERDKAMHKKLEADTSQEKIKKKSIQLIVQEMYPECCDEMMMNFDKAYDLFCIKQYDYGDSNIRLGLNLRSSQTSESLANSRFAQMGVVIRMNDKISRLVNLYKKNEEDISAVNESVEDTAMDLMNYANILLTLRNNKWGK